MDEVFGVENFMSRISDTFQRRVDRLIQLHYLLILRTFILWYAKDKTRVKFRAPYAEKKGGYSYHGSGNYR